ncbi:hypothetical protein PGTUg99_009721 [Puccinia graminis f. sp. tritici]|uniref:Uncharacterized protein n=1 Tax=Puccinia graminis f. sp. tritici TaxID=56615 RepID=A0A5B0S1Q6_PUCGR|nr:hypothetical protein PGTUg99_009721 [Puccinia graminis f. sp. tritici]
MKLAHNQVSSAYASYQRCNRSDPRIGIYRGSDRNVPQYCVLGSDRFSDPIPIYQMIGISWGDPIRAAWELGIGIAQADPIFSRSWIVARRHYLAIARPPPLVVEVPGLPSASSLSNLTTPPPSLLHCSPKVRSDSDSIGHRPASPTRR